MQRNGFSEVLASFFDGFACGMNSGKGGDKAMKLFAVFTDYSPIGENLGLHGFSISLKFGLQGQSS